jgi:hypothetical protein
MLHDVGSCFHGNGVSEEVLSCFRLGRGTQGAEAWEGGTAH